MTRAIFSFIAIFFVAVSTGGCNIVGPIAYITAPEPTIDAQYTLPMRKTVVFVDDRMNVVNPISLRTAIADQVTEALLREQLLTDLIRPGDAMAYASNQDRATELLSIGKIGRAVGADQVIYIQMQAFRDRLDRYTAKAGAVGEVKVLDVRNNVQLFPPDNPIEFGTGESTEQQEKDTVTVRSITDELPGKMYESRTGRLGILQMLALQFGEDIAKVFYEHKPADALGERLQQP